MNRFAYTVLGSVIITFFKKSYRILLTFMLLFGFLVAKSQCFINVPSSDGYVVNVDIKITSINAPKANCEYGYNYTYTLDYTAVFTGSNIPSGMWTLQGSVKDDVGEHFFDLNNNGGTGVTTTANAYTGLSNCSTVNTGYFHPEISIVILGPGIPSQKIPVFCNTLPVTLLDFKGYSTEDKVLLNWSTASEKDNDYFVLERYNNDQWKTISIIDGHGTTYSKNTYNTVDLSPLNLNYYRLKQVDLDGEITYSDVISVKYLSDDKVLVYQDPTDNSNVNIKLKSESNSDVEIMVYDLLCHEHKRHIIQKNNTELIHELHLFKNSMYLILVKQNNEILGRFKVISN